MKYMVNRIKLCMVFLAVLLSYAGSQALAEVNVNINIGVPAPPAVVVEAPPAMVFLPQPGVFVAVGIPYSIFFISSHYYYFHNDHWFRSTGYGGPWIQVKHKSLPPGLRKYKIHQLHTFRDREFKVYREHGPKYKGRHFIADDKHGHKSKGHPEKGHKKHNKGKRD